MSPGRRGEAALSALLGLAVVGVWELVVRALAVPEYLVPAPTAVIMALGRGLASGVYVIHLGYTLLEALLGFAIGSLIGLMLGAAIARSPLLERVLYPYVVGFQAMPKIAIAPLLILWMGFGIWSKVAMAAMIAFFPMLVNVITGLRSADRDSIDLMRSLSASEWQIYRMVRLPNALPYIFAALDIAIVFSLLAAIVAEFVGAQVGMGNLILQMNSALDVAGVFAVLIILSAVGVMLHLVVVKLQRRVVFWGGTSDTTGKM